MSTEELLPLIKNQLAALPDTGRMPPDDLLIKVIGLYRVRIKKLSEFAGMTDHFFSDTYSIDAKAVEKYISAKEGKDILREFSSRLEGLNDFSHSKTEEACRTMVEEKKIKAGAIIHPTRVAISGKTTGAGLFEMMEAMGKDKVIERMKKAAV